MATMIRLMHTIQTKTRGSYFSDQYSDDDYTDDDDSGSKYDDSSSEYSNDDYTDDDDLGSEYDNSSSDDEDSGSELDEPRLLFKPTHTPKNNVEKHKQLLEYFEEGVARCIF